MTTLIVVRHGQSEGNLQKRFVGHGNAALTALGIRQAELTARFLRDYPISKIYSSDLLRSMQTAEPTARIHGLPILPEPRLREIYAGEWENKTYDELSRDFADSFQLWKTDIGHGHPEGGESVADLARRVYTAADELLALNRDSCIAFFTHATPARLLACRWFGYPPECAAQVPWAGNASVSVVEYADIHTAKVVLYGYDNHLGDLATGFRQGNI